ncbi:MAG: hypothetical protein ABIH72_05810 [archaeon]
MKRGIILSAVLCLIILCSAFSLALLSPGSTNSAGVIKNSFETSEMVYVKGTGVCTINKQLDLYIVQDKSNWAGGEDLVDVRGAAQKVTTDGDANLAVTKIWEVPLAGDYDIIVDCNNNGKFDADPILEPIDSLSSIGFSVVGKAGTGKIELGSHNPADHSWQYDTENPELNNVMMQFKLSAEGENIMLSDLNLKDIGDADLSKQITKIEVYADDNNNGRKDSGEKMIGDSALEGSEAKVNLAYLLGSNVSKNFIIVYVMMPEADVNLIFSLVSLNGEGETSGEKIAFSGTPLNSSLKNILGAKSCTGLLTLSFDPASVEEGGNVKARMDNLSGCNGKTLNLRSASCSGLAGVTLCSCEVNGSGCECNFKSESSNKTYWACIDKNNDTDTSDAGESVSLMLVTGKVSEEESGEQEEEISEIDEDELESISEDAGGLIEDAGLLFIVIEITLVLILVVLLLILAALNREKEV